jgi:superoxide dismutase, Cu-Zn family
LFTDQPIERLTFETIQESSMKRSIPTAVALACTALAGCATMQNPPGLTAVATIQPTTSASAANLNPNGEVKFTQLGNGKVLVEAKVAGLKPNSEHGFHVHAVSDCSGDGMKTAGHFNPDNHPHAHPSERARHAGALFNLKTDDKGVGTLKQEADTITLVDGVYGIVGKPLVVHRDADDYKSQPLGNAGPRVGCALIAKR